MKLSAKPISSPGRTDKFPPPLMMFLKSNAGSRSRRSRSSPMFVRKKNATTIETQTQEPSSPKVTCMGQVRVKRTSKRDISPTRCRCRWVPKPNPFRCRPIWPFFRPKPTDLKQDTYSNFDQESDSVFQAEKVNNVDYALASNSNTPPTNALLLTRCRSAPYKSSSLASRFWGSPISLDQQQTHFPNAQSTSEGPQTEFNSGLPQKVEELTNEKDVGSDTALRPTVLTRCKSEPARTGLKLDPLLNSLFKNRRLEFD